ncbi:sensor histidine kinase [Marinobacter adhaerens]|uniref:sensor histidine kinase n=1 Tax=Marinobacter adhaerens TaxID=1033846 RepID=UPI001E2A93DA|nr:sensor histidine kinase [Marinobacter adhaerens]MCD1645944.1 sensor histidine kinase [Marinobacter adhaerens]
MNHRLLWKLCGTLALGTLVLFWTISFLGAETEQKMSFIAEQHQQTIKAWGRTAERLYQSGDEQALARWLEELQARENTWAAVVRSDIQPLAESRLTDRFREGFRLGRSVEWKIHLYFVENPIMEVTFADPALHFLVLLPERMRPGTYLPEIKLMLKLALPLAVLVIMCLVIYRHLMTPLRQLEFATRQFTDGNLGVRVRAMLGNRNDELAALAETFDRMAERTGTLILTQRRLIADLSHELRTPLARIEMALSCAQEGIDTQHLLPRIQRECGTMRNLVEDTLTLAWLENEKPSLSEETLDLIDLLDSILDDARYEYPDHTIDAELPDGAELAGSSHRALAQAIENVIRNACNYTPAGGTVRISLRASERGYRLEVADQGPGVPLEQLDLIFKPFFRSAKARDHLPTGYGLGLALARRQVEATGGWIRAENLSSGGLLMRIWLPMNASEN